MKKNFFTPLTATLILVLSIFSIFFSGCSTKEKPLSLHVSELRSNVYSGKCEYTTLTATYGYRETPYSQDGSVAQKIYALTFTCSEGLNTEISHFISLDYNGKNYKTILRLNPAKNALQATMPIENFNCDTFVAILSYGTENQQITMTSQLPKNMLNHQNALEKLQEKQPSLIKSMCDDKGNFQGEIYQRAVVKNGKCYWYVGLIDKSGKIKAFLLDGISGEPLAVREIF